LALGVGGVTVKGGNSKKSEDSSSSSSESSGSSGPDERELDFRRGGLLLNSIGAEGYRIFSKWKIPATDISYCDLVKRYEAQFNKRQNLFITRHRFLSLEQLSTEKVELFIDRVSKSASFCRFGDLEDDMILQIVTKGIKSDRLRKDLLSTQDLDLGKARNICLLFTTAEESNDIITEKADADVAAISKGKPNRFSGRRKAKGCFNCHAEDHWVKECPRLKDLVCRKCNVKGHIARFCSKNKGEGRVREIGVESVKQSERSAESDESF